MRTFFFSIIAVSKNNIEMIAISKLAVKFIEIN